MPGDATVIGRIAIKVVPDTEDFRKDAKRELSIIEKSLKPLDIGLTLNTAGLKAEANKAVSDVQRSLKDLKLNIGVNDRQKRVAQTELAAISRNRSVELLPKVNKTAAAKTLASLSALSGAATIGDIGSGFGNWIASLPAALPRLAATSLAITNLSSASLAGVANLLAFGSSLASVSGSALALPGILGGLAIGAGATIAVLKDFNSVLPEVADKFAALQDRMSSRFWKVAEQPLRSFINTILPQFSAGLGRTSTALGGFFANLATASKDVFSNQLDGMFADLNGSIRIASTYTDSFVGVLQKLGAVGAGNLPRLAGFFGDITERFDAWLAGKGTAGLQGYVDTGIAALKDLGGVIRFTGSTLAGLARAAEKAGGGTLASLSNLLRGVSEQVNSPVFQRSLTGVFQASADAMDTLTSRSGPAFRRFMLRLSDTLTNVLPKAGETAGTALSAIFDALDQAPVQETVERLFERLDVAVSNLAPTLPGVARALASVLDVASNVGVQVSRALAPALEGLSPAISDLADDLNPLVAQLGDLLVNAVKGSTPVLVDLAGVLGDIAGATAAVLKPVNELLSLFGKLPGPVQSAVGALASAGAVVGASVWFGTAIRAKVAAFGIAMTQAGTQATVAQGALFRAGAAAQAVTTRMSAARLGLAGAGIALATLGTEAAGSNDKLSLLASAGGGALLGFSVGGPVGAAIGGGAGALLHLATNAGKANTVIAEGKPIVADYASTLDGLSAAATTATRELAFLELQKSGLIAKGNALGLSSRELVSSFINAKGATSSLATSLAQMSQPYKDILARGGELTTSQAEQFRTINELAQAFGNSRQAYQSQVQDQQELRRATADLSAELKGFPKSLVSRLDIKGLPESGRELARLAGKYDLVPKEIRTLIEASGVKVSLAAIQRVVAQMRKADRTNANPEIKVDTKRAEGDAKGIETRVRNIDKLEGASLIRVDDKATKPIGEVQALLKRYATTTVTATAKLRDQATSGINAIRANLQRLNGSSATVTTNHRSVYTRQINTAAGGGGPVLPGIDERAVVERAGRNAGRQFVDNFSKTVERYLNKTGNLFDRLLDKTKTKRQREAMRELFDARLDGLKELTQRHEKWMRQLDQARDKLKAVRADLKAFKDQTRQTIVDFANPTAKEFGGYDDLVAQMQNAAAEAAEFERVIKELIKGKLNATTLQQILSAGPEAGMSAAQAILSGGVAQINAIQAQINAAANGVAAAAGTELFGGLLNAAQSDVDKLIGKLKPLQARLRQFATDLIKALREQLNREFAKARTESARQIAGTAAGTVPTKIPGSGLKIEETHSSRKAAGSPTLIYNAAPGPQVTAEEQLFAAGKRGRMVFVGG